MSRRWLLYTGAATLWWLGSGVVNGAQARSLIMGSGVVVSWRDVLVVNVVAALTWVPFTLLVLWMTERFPIGQRRARALLIHLAALVGTLVLRGYLVAVLNLVMGYPRVPPVNAVLTKSVLSGLVFYVMLVGAAHAIYYARLHRERESLLGRAELNALRAKIQPHFLYNALNAITALVHDQPRQVEEMITRLGDLLRHSLDSGDALEVPLREEIDMLHAYLDIEQVRFSDRLTVKWAVQAEVLDALVPPLLLQPLAENAIRHGLAQRADPGLILISADRQNGHICLRVEDDGIGLPGGVPLPGVGLGTARARLSQMYGRNHKFTVCPRPGGGVIAELTLPYRPEARP